MRKRYPLKVEPLEDRTAPAVVTYTAGTDLLDFTADIGDIDDVIVLSPGPNQVQIQVGNGDTIDLQGGALANPDFVLSNPTPNILTINTAPANSPIALFDINLGDQNDTLNFSLASNPIGVANVDINGGSGNDTTTFNGPVNIDGNLNVVSDQIAVDAQITAAGGAGNVTLNAGDAITDGNGAANNITATALMAVAGTGISLDTNVDTLDLQVTIQGGAINIDEADAVTLASITTGQGSITVTAGGTLTAQSVSTGSGGSPTVSLTTNAASGGDVLVGFITTSGTIAIVSDAAITEIDDGSDNDGFTDITASTVNLTAQGDIRGRSSNDALDINVNTGTNQGLMATVNTNAGVINIREQNALRVRSATTTDGDITIVAASGLLIAETVTAGGAGDVLLTSPTSSATVGNITAADDTVTINAGTSILELGNDADADVAATTIDLTAQTGIGTGTNGTLDIDADDQAGQGLTATVNGTGNIDVRDVNTLRVNNVDTTDGSITIKSDGAITLNGNVLANGAMRRLTLDVTTGGLNQTGGRILADEVLLTGAGNFSLEQATNDAGTLDALINGSLAFRESNSLFLDDLDGTNDFTAVDNVTITVGTVGQDHRLTLSDNGFSLDVTSPTSGNEQVNFTADAMTLNGTVNAGAGTVSLVQFENAGTGTGINLGGADGAAVLGLDDNDLDNINAGQLQIGNSSTGQITLEGTINPSSVDDLRVTTGRSIVDDNSTGNDIEVTTLTLTAVEGIGTAADLIEIDVNDLTIVNSTSGSVNVREADNINAIDIDNTGRDVILVSEAGFIRDADNLTDITAGDLTIRTENGIGASVTTLAIDVNRIDVANFTVGSTEILAISDLEITDLTTPGGAGTDFTGPGDGIAGQLNTPGTITATGNLTISDDVNLQDDFTFAATAGQNDVRITEGAVLNLNNGGGNTLTIDGNLVFDSTTARPTFLSDINGPIPDVDHDRIIVTGATRTTTLGGAELDVVVNGAFQTDIDNDRNDGDDTNNPILSQTFTIIDNVDVNTTTNGLFADENGNLLPDLTSFMPASSTVPFTVDYDVDGDDADADPTANDVVLRFAPIVEFTQETYMVNEADDGLDGNDADGVNHVRLVTLRRTGNLALESTVTVNVIGGTAQGAAQPFDQNQENNDFDNSLFPLDVVFPALDPLANGGLGNFDVATTQVFEIAINDDIVPEAKETIQLQVEQKDGGNAFILGQSQATLEIQNDDSGTLRVDPIAMSEGTGGTTNFQFRVALTSAVASVTRVDFDTASGTAIEGVDFVGLAGQQLVFAEGDDLDDPQFVNVTVNADAVVELNENFLVNFGALVADDNNDLDGSNDVDLGAENVPFSTPGVIQNDDVAQLSVSNGTVVNSVTGAGNEGDLGTSTITITVTLDNDVDTAVTVDIATVDGTATAADNDYVPNNETLLFNGFAGEQQTFTVTVNPDEKFESDESFLVQLSNPNASGRDVQIGNGVGVGAIVNDDKDPGVIGAAAGQGGAPHVRTFNFDMALADIGNVTAGLEQSSFLAYGVNFTGGVRIATGDVNGDLIPDIVTGPGPGGGPHVKVFDGVTGTEIRSFFAYDPLFIGGIYVGAGDINDDGFDDIITGAGLGGGPHVRVFDGNTGGILRDFFAYDPLFTGGVRVAGGDVNNDNFADIITGAGPGGGPHVKVFSGQTGQTLQSFFAFAPTVTGGVFVASGEVNGDNFLDVLVSAQTPNPVNIFNGQTNALLSSLDPFAGTQPPASPNQSDVRVASIDANADGFADILTSTGPGLPPEVRLFDGATLQELDSFFAFDPAFLGGVFLG